MPQISMEGKRVAYARGGVPWRASRSTLALLHGAGGDRTVWALQARALAHDGWNVLALDLPGHGQSEDVAGLTSIEDLSRWLRSVLKALDVERVALAGHSMGACVALTFAASFPEVTKALALLGTASSMPVNEALLNDTLHAHRRALDMIESFAHGTNAKIGRSPNPGVSTLGAADALMRRCVPSVLHRDFSLCNAWSAEKLIPQVSAPSLVISGKHDRMTPAKRGMQLAESLGRYTACSHRLLDSGHMLMGEAPRETMLALRSFFRACREPAVA